MQPFKNKRPYFLNLFQIRFPVTAVLSILHRISGVIMVIGFPMAIYLFDLSLHSQQGFTEVHNILTQGIGRWFVLLLVWSICHHFYAGIRYFLIDFEWVTSRQAARQSAIIVIILALISTAILFMGVTK